MEQHILQIIFIYFIIGAVSIFFINKKIINKKQAKERWVKYFVYLLIVCSIVASLYYNIIFNYIALIILILGLYELVKVSNNLTKNGNIKFVAAILFYALIGFLFYNYSLIKENKVELLVYIIVFTFDGFSQIIGQLFGKHKFLKSISPNKTIEGLIGGYITALITVLVLRNDFELRIDNALPFVVIICSAAFIGDILASLYKRICKVKDYSNLIPGHGGVLDRFDSFIMAGAVYFALNYFQI